MTCLRAPRDLITIVGEGLIDGNLTLKSAAIVPVAPQRRDENGWPGIILSAVVVGPNMYEGVSAVWATCEYVAPILAVDGAAREFSVWPAPGRVPWDIAVDLEALLAYPEVEEARKCALLLEARDLRVSGRAANRDRSMDVEDHPHPAD